MTPDEFRQLGHRLVDWVADYRERVHALPVMSRVKPGEIKAQLPSTPPAQREPFDDVLADLERIILPGITHWAHPSFFAYFPSNATFASVLGDLLASGLGVQGMSWQTSPAATELEEVVMDWLRQMVGLPTDFTGVIHDTASTATLTALICARERSTHYAQARGGFQEHTRVLTVYGSDQAHSSIEKAGSLAGFGRLHLRVIPSDQNHALRIDALEAAIARDLAGGCVPCAIVASVGTTATTAVDPLERIANIAAAHDIWLHVDAAMAGTAMLLPECREMWKGVERADSLVLNPHKWMGAGFDFSAYFVRDPQHLIRVMSTDPSYLRTAQDGEVKNLRDWGIPLGRRFRALKLWLLLRDQGVEGLQARIRRDLANAQWLAGKVDGEPDWERLAPVPLQTVCLRHRPQAMPESALNAHNLKLAQQLNLSGKAYLTPAVVKGVQLIRVSIGVESTERAEVEALWDLLRQTAAHC